MWNIDNNPKHQYITRIYKACILSDNYLFFPVVVININMHIRSVCSN
jgi:hypothetical protein